VTKEDKMAKKVVVLGSFVVDLTSRAPHLPVPGETVLGTRFKMGPGGKGANQGVAAKRAGADVIMITKVGEDAFGRMAIDNFSREGFDTDYILTDSERETGTALIMVDDATGQNMILVVGGACANFTDADMQRIAPTITSSDILLTQLEINMDATEKAIDMAHSAGVDIVLNTAPVQPVSDELLAKVTYITPNEVEASILTGVDIKQPSDAAEAAKVFFSKGVRGVVITLGERGVFVSDGSKEELIAQHRVDVVETTGAGDAFTGAFVTALAEGQNIFAAARFGNAAAALSVTKLGTAPAMPYRADIDAFLDA
jgi:ribokinase